MTESGQLVESWQGVGDPAPHELGPARVLVRQVATVVAAVQPDETVGLEWLEADQALATDLIVTGREPFRAAVRPRDPTLVLCDLHGAILATRPLEGSTLRDAATWLRDEAVRHGGTFREPVITHQDLVAAQHRAAFAEMGRWLANADRLLRNLARHTEHATPVRFDPARGELQTVIALEARSGEPTRDVVVGLSCGDASVAEPYFFARPHPISELTELPSLPLGARWVREPEVEAVMPCSSVASDRDADAQAQRVVAFIEAAVPAAHGLVHRNWARR